MVDNKIKSTNYDLIFCILVMVLPLNYKAPNILLTILLVWILFNIKKNCFEIKRYNKLEFKLFITLILFWVLKSILTGTFSEFNYLLMLPLILLPIAYTKVKDKNRILYAIVISSIILSFRAIFNMINYFITNGELLPFEGPIINEIIGAERPYLSFYTLIAILSCYELHNKRRLNQYLFLFTIVFFVVFIFMISARISAITLIFISILYFVLYLKTSLIKKTILTIIFFSLITGLVSINSNIRERFFLTGSFNEFMIKLNQHEPRVVIWDCAFDISQRDDFNPLIGFSSKLEIENLFKECFGEKISNKYRASYFFESINNSHNQFINTYLVSGLIGLILFSSFFILQLIQYRRNFFKTAMLISLIFFLLVENMLSREFGVYIFCLTILLIDTDWIDENFKKRI